MEPTLSAFVPGAPGGPELLILLFMLLFLVGVPLVVVAGAVWLFTRRSGGDEDARERIVELEREVQRLERQVERLESESAESDAADSERAESDG